MRWTARRFWVLSGALVLSAGACSDAPPEIIDATWAENFVGQRLPTRAANIRVYAQRGIDTRVLVRFDAPNAGARDFARRLLRRPPVAERDSPLFGRGAGEPDWWTPQWQPGRVGGHALFDEQNRAFRVLLTPRGAERSTVWLEAYSG